MKKNWIYIKCGLSRDPKHRAQMGECVWLYMHIIDRADWETGVAFGWKDEEEAKELSMPVDTLRRQRAKLEEHDYIRCQKKQYGQDIAIVEWRNPREYDSEVRNPRQSLHETLPQSLNQSLNQTTAQVRTPTSNSLSLSDMPVDWKLAHGQEVTQAELDAQALKDLAPKQFERAFGTGQWPWWSNSVWEKFAKFVIAEYSDDQLAFGNYVVWRAGDGKYTGFSNKKIRENPQAFMDTGWPEFKTQREAQRVAPTNGGRVSREI